MFSAGWLPLLLLSAAPLCLGKGVLLPDSSLASVYQNGEAPPAQTVLASSSSSHNRRRRERSTKGSFLSSFLDGTTEAKNAAEEVRKDAAVREKEPAISATHPPRKRAARGGSSAPEAGESTAFFFGSDAPRASAGDSLQRAPLDASNRPSAHDRHARGSSEMPEGVGGTRPLPAGGTRPVAPAGVSDMFGAFTTMAREIANFIASLVDMSCTMFVTLLKKAVTGASPVAAAEKTGMGMIEYLQPYGWDPYGPGNSEDGYQQQRPETATCHYLQQTWQRQCAASPETVGLMEASLLQLSEGGAAAASAASAASEASAASDGRGPRRRLLAGRSDAPPVEGEAAGEVAGEKDAQVLYESSLKALPSSLRGWLDQLPSITPEQQRAWSAGTGAAGRPQAPSDASAPSAALAAMAAAMPAAAAVASAAAAPGTSGFKLMGTLNAGMMGLGASLYNGPDLYDPSGPNGAEPVPQTTGPEKCYRLLNSWIYKCAVSPM